MDKLNLILKIWRQSGPSDSGGFETYNLENLNAHMSFLEMIDVLNEKLVAEDKDCLLYTSPSPRDS